MNKLALAVLALAALPGAAPRESESITYETGACFGFCPIYRVTVGADGSGVFVGRRFTTVVGERGFRLSSAQYRVFAAHLAPLRPAAGTIRYDNEARCGPMPTDMPTVDVGWQGPGRRAASIHYYYGCSRQRAMAERLRTAPALLPIAAWIAPAPDHR
jgi:Domain of unknown function (DUF6438)